MSNIEGLLPRVQSSDAAFLTGGGDMGTHMRAHDWSSSPLGDPSSWPQALRAVAALMINSRYPMFIAWGPELGFLYNDCYAPILGAKHPHALGRPFREVWSDIWADIAPLIDGALRGEATYHENLHLVMERNGVPEDTWYSFSYSPLRDDNGQIAGMFCVCSETTEKVLAERRSAFLSGLEQELRDLSDPLEITAAAQRALGEYLKACRVGYGEVEETQRYFTTAANWTDGTVPPRHGTHDLAGFGPEIWAALRRGESLLIRDVAEDPRTNAPAALEAFAAIDTAAAITASLVKDGKMRAALYVHHREPQLWSNDDAVLVEEVAERTWAATERARAEARRRDAEQKLRLERDRSRGVLDRMAEGFVLLDRDFRVLDINDEGMRLETRPREAIIGKTHWEAWPGTEGSELGKLYKRAMAEREPASIEHHYEWPDEHRAWVETRAYPTADGLAIFYRDVTERKQGEERLRRRSSQLQELARTALVVAQAPTLGRTLDEITRAARRIIGAHQGVVSLTQGSDWSQAINAVDLTAKYDEWRDYAAATEGSGIYAWVCENNRPVRMTQAELEAHPRWRGFGAHATDHPPMRGWLAAPLIARDGHNLGLIQLSDKEDGGDFDDADEAMLVQLAQLASAAVEQSLAERTIAEREAHLAAIFEQSAAGLSEADASGRLVRVNDRFCEITGRSREELFQLRMHDITHPDDLPNNAALFDRSAGGGDAFDIEKRYVKPDGTVVWVHNSVTTLRDADGRPNSVLCATVDITRRKAAEARLLETEARLRLALDAAGMAVWEFDVASDTLVASPELNRLLGRPEDSPLDIAEFRSGYYPGDENRVRDAAGAALERGERHFATEFRHSVASGAIRWFMLRAMVVERPDGSLEKVTGVVADVTERKEFDDRLRESEATVRAFFETANLYKAVVELGADDFCFVTANGQLTRVLGQSELSGRFASEIFDSLAVRAMLQRLRKGHAAGRPTTIEYPFDLGGARHWFVATLSPMPAGAAGKPRLSVASLDITDRKHAEAELKRLNETLEQRVMDAVAEREQARDALRQSQKMESLGQLVGGIAHDFNNLLTGIIGSLDLLERRVSIGRTENMERYTTTALASAKRAAALTQRLLAFSRRQALDPKPVDVNVLVKSMEDLVRRSVGEQIVVETALAGGLWATKIDRNELEHALLNLCVNARDAMPEGGRITVETSNGFLDDAYVARHADVKAGQYVVLGVTDTGTGMTPEIMERVFEPFYTTKPIGQGTGLGLSQLHGFVKQSGGHVALYSEVGQGTTVKIYLPRYYGAVVEEPRVTTDLPVAEAKETVLIVEDEDTVRMLVMDVLDELGYGAHEAVDARSALRILEGGARIDLLITDVGLPGMNGRQLADRARELRPGLKTLFITGYAHNAAVGNGLLEPGMEVLTKPFAVDRLASKIRDMVTRAGDLIA